MRFQHSSLRSCSASSRSSPRPRTTRPRRCRSRQDWTNTSQINFADNWSTGGPAPNTPGVQGIIGFLGQDITTLTGHRSADAARRLRVRHGRRCDPEPDQHGHHQWWCRGIPTREPGRRTPGFDRPRMRRTSCSTSTRPALRTSPFRTTCATSTRPGTTRSSSSLSSTASAPAASSRMCRPGYVADATDRRARQRRSRR